MFAMLRPQRLLFSHYGPVPEVEETLARSAEEIQLWVAETKAARGAGLDFDHTVALVHRRTRERYAALGPDADPALAAKFETLSSTASSVAGIVHWLDRAPQPS
jgi:hypothetical protein